MPTFQTPEPIAVDVELGAGRLRVTASDRTDTTVEVRPSDPRDESDVKAADQVTVDYEHGALRIIAPKARAFDFSRKTRSVEVTVELPAGSDLTAHVQLGDIDGSGRLGACRLKTSAGNVRVDHTGALHVDVSAGHITAGDVDGNADVATSSGTIRLGRVSGSTSVKNSNGGTTVDEAAGDLRVRASNGDITLGRAAADVDARTSNGSIRLGEVVRGSIQVATSMGDLDVGIAAGTAAWLAADTDFGQVTNLLDEAAGPETGDETAEVRAHTSFGAVTVRRA